MKKPLSLESDFVVLSPEKKGSIEKMDAGLYPRLDANYGGFAGHQLISCHEFDSDWPSWEIHPHGDEIVILMSGKTKLILQTEAGETSIDLNQQGQYVLIPKGIWHTAKTSKSSKLLFITPGEGTQNRDI